MPVGITTSRLTLLPAKQLWTMSLEVVLCSFLFSSFPEAAHSVPLFQDENLWLWGPVTTCFIYYTGVVIFHSFSWKWAEKSKYELKYVVKAVSNEQSLLQAAKEKPNQKKKPTIISSGLCILKVPKCFTILYLLDYFFPYQIPDRIRAVIHYVVSSKALYLVANTETNDIKVCFQLKNLQ